MPFPNTKALIKHSSYMLVFLTHTTILNETQVPKVLDSTMIVKLEPASFLPFWLEFHVQTNGCKNTHVVSNSTFLCDRRNYFYLAGIAVSPLPTSTLQISLQLHRPQKADVQSMFCNLPKENHPKSSYDMTLELKDALSFPLNQIQLALHQ